MGMDSLTWSWGLMSANSDNGTSYVVFGSRGGFPPSFNLTNLNGSNGFVIPGVAANGDLGSSVSTAGDVNGDGLADLVLGAPWANSSNGTSYVLFGTRGGFPPSFNLANLNGSNGFVIPGVAAGGELGSSVSTQGISMAMVSPIWSWGLLMQIQQWCELCVVWDARWISASFNLTNLNGSNGFVIPGVAAGGYLGCSVSTAGDVNGDGIR